MGEKRESFTNKIGFMLSCVGAAIGLGNIWLFSWKLGKYGGAAFLIPYFCLLYTSWIGGIKLLLTYDVNFVKKSRNDSGKKSKVALDFWGDLKLLKQEIEKDVGEEEN